MAEESTQIGALTISPPVVNSSSPWASDLNDLRQIYASNSTGAVTTRTATLEGFKEDPHTHQVTIIFLDQLPLTDIVLFLDLKNKNKNNIKSKI
jgi:hypothetical protein